MAEALSVKELREILKKNSIESSQCIEKSELVDLVKKNNLFKPQPPKEAHHQDHQENNDHKTEPEDVIFLGHHTKPNVRPEDQGKKTVSDLKSKFEKHEEKEHFEGHRYEFRGIDIDALKKNVKLPQTNEQNPHEPGQNKVPHGQK
eukprot:TRINITY_DN3365_c0_g1_i1.p1 TRINITY_DN3365_c0_g1~~TRINITY_DN3365_c0_g1_i1.p1  ORF type:complete len:153 (-),score=38.80 TRINITY_DN3365_c0_g1_i1:89-526(-)